MKKLMYLMIPLMIVVLMNAHSGEGTTQITGTIINQHLEPVPHVFVKVFGDTWSRTTYTQGDGSYIVQGMPGEYSTRIFIPVVGDMNGDGVLNVADILLLQKKILK